MAPQIFLHKELRYSILDLCIETQLSALLLILASNAAYPALQSFPFHPQYKDLAHSILV
jgi:hypothetical protein